MNKKIIFAILLFIIILAGICYWIYRESSFSGELISVSISGPATATVGNEITYTIKYKNTGNFVLRNLALIFDMPDNSLTEDSKTRIIQNLKNINPGEEESLQIKTRLLGQEGDLKTAKASLAYTPQNLTAPYEADASFTTKLDTVPIDLNFNLPAKIEKGKNLQYSINYLSNIDYPLENSSIKIEPVSGFDFVSSNPISLDNSEWKLQTLNKGQGGQITINGNVSADVNQNLAFTAFLGMRQNGSFIVIKQTTANAQVVQPLIFVTQQVNGSDSYTASAGETLNYKLFFKNISPAPFINLSATVKLNSPALDMSSIQANGGQFQQSSNTIVWNYGQEPQLMYIGPQQQAELDFSVKVKNSWDASAANNSAINDEINISQYKQKFSIKVNQ